jgi:hypothetical protein
MIFMIEKSEESRCCLFRRIENLWRNARFTSAFLSQRCITTEALRRGLRKKGIMPFERKVPAAAWLRGELDVAVLLIFTRAGKDGYVFFG